MKRSLCVRGRLLLVTMGANDPRTKHDRVRSTTPSALHRFSCTCQLYVGNHINYKKYLRLIYFANINGLRFVATRSSATN